MEEVFVVLVEDGLLDPHQLLSYFLQLLQVLKTWYALNQGRNQGVAGVLLVEAASELLDLSGGAIALVDVKLARDELLHDDEGRFYGLQGDLVILN